jgi:hypothetical protein
MKHSLCPTCGHPVTVLLAVEKLGVILAPRQRQLYELVEKAGTAGIAAGAIFERMYANDPDGGPDSGSSIVSVMVRQLNKKLYTTGLEIRSSRGPYALYRLVNTEPLIAS